VHVAAAAGCPWLEYNPNVLTVADAYLRQPLVVADAAYQVPRTPGLRIELNEERLRRDLKSYC
jgi:L-alanine-DL-glutamate epimerase-like enolase superfamily enzyme